jgi:pimeloyl-[acyl-carrier protein] methyl ester esterase
MAWIHGWGFTPEVWGDLQHQLPDYKHIFIEDAATYVPTEVQIVVGWSLGAMQAIELAAAYPNAIYGVIVLAGTLQFCRDNRNLGWPKRIVQRMMDALDVDANEVVMQFRRQIDCPDSWMTLPIPDVSELRNGLVYLRDSNMQESFQMLKRPILWIHGEMDEICPVGAIPGQIAPVRLTDVGHMPFLDKRCMDTIRGWLHAYQEGNGS